MNWRQPSATPAVWTRASGRHCWAFAALLALLGVAAPAASTDPAPAGDGSADGAAPAKKPPATVPLTVRVSGLRGKEGHVAVALFASAADFPDQKRALAGKLSRIDKGRAAVTFDNLRPGVYAVAVLHDENSNSKMDFNFLGMPLEGYGFSNDASAPFGPPSFEDAAFKLSARASFIPVKIRYFL